MISILMPIYNGIEFIDESVNSIINQSYKDWELIIAINGHNQNSKEYNISKKYEFIDRRIIVKDLYNFKGKGNTLNEMLKFCKYNYIALLDVDDIWLPNKLEKQIKYTNKYDIIGTKCIYFGDSNIIPNIPVGDLSKFDFLKYNPIINSSCIIKKSICYWEDIKIEDYKLWIKLWIENYKFYNLNDILVKHRIHNDSAFNSKGNNIEANNLLSKYRKLRNEGLILVSSWYNIKSKFNIEKYKIWISNLLNNITNFKLIIYTNKESEHIINNFNNKNIEIIIKEFNEFKCYKWKNSWIKNHNNNDLLNKNSIYNTDWKLNMLWNEKINFVKEVYDSNKYKLYNYIGWCDLGYFRENTTIDISKWPNKNKILNLNNNKIYYSQVCDKDTINYLFKLVLNKNKHGLPNIPIPPNQNSIAGGFFITNKKNIDNWYNIYYEKLDLYFKNNYLIKDDQIIILDCILNNLNFFYLINEDQNKWFGFQNYLY
jgi:glycosyltransferase involved in cell wall biosynthesis